MWMKWENKSTMNEILPQLEKKAGTFKIRDQPFSDSYIIEEEIGRGKFAKVKKCRHKDNGVIYAAKFLRKRRKGEDCRNEILHEVAMLQRALEHPRLVHLVDVYETTQELILVTEFAAGGELFHHFVHEECFEEKEVIRLMRQILEGLSFLHENSIVHLDVKPQNILLTESLPQGDIKLCDFGFARLVDTGEDIRDILGTPDYVAPEVLDYEPIKTASDMWSVGVLTYVMLTGCSPFAGETKQETFLNISQVNIDFPDELFANISANAKDFVSKLLVSNPSERLKAHECLKHAWLHTTSQPTKSAATPTTSPIGSPIGCRRAHSPPSSEIFLEFEAHSKKYKYDNDTCNSTALVGNTSEEKLVNSSCYSMNDGEFVKNGMTVTNSITDTQLAC